MRTFGMTDANYPVGTPVAACSGAFIRSAGLCTDGKNYFVEDVGVIDTRLAAQPTCTTVRTSAEEVGNSLPTEDKLRSPPPVVGTFL